VKFKVKLFLQTREHVAIEIPRQTE